MALLPENLDYSDRDFDSIRLRLQSLIRSTFPKWTDFNIANFGNLLLELFGFNMDVLGLYQDNQALEAFIAKATQRKNLIALSKLLGFTPAGAGAAQSTVQFTLSSSPLADVTLPKGLFVQTAEVTDPIVFQLLSDLTIVSGQIPPTVSGIVENSLSQEDIFDASGLPNQEVILGQTPYLDDSAIITAGNGTFTQVQDFLDSTSSDKHFSVVVDQNDKATVRFGNGISGVLPFGTITVDYKTGGGAAGIVEIGAISKCNERVVDVNGNPQTVSVTNAARSNGGTDRATVEQIRTLAPQSLRVQNRTVSREDYEINALKIPGVARALMTTSNEDSGVTENAGILYIIPTGGGLPTTLLKESVLTQVTVTYPNTLTFRVQVFDPVYLDANFFMVVYRAQGVTKAKAGSAIRAALPTYFAIQNSDGTANEKVNFGFYFKNASGNPDGSIPFSHLYDLVNDLPEIRKVGAKVSDFLINDKHDDLTVTVSQFPRLGTISIIDGDDGGVL